jgi:negative regulator of replication initiation
MKTIEIDEEVYAYLQSKAIPYEDKNPNDTIRRLFEFDKKAIPSQLIPLPQMKSRKVEGRKKRKASLIELVNAGLLEEGQILHVRDYQGREIPDSEAVVHQGRLLRNGVKYSMSNLAEKLLKGQGYESDSVRGPAH